MESKFKVVEEIILNGKVVQEIFDEYGDFLNSYDNVKTRLNTYLKDILDTKEVEEFSIYGNGIDFTIKNSYYVDNNLEKEEINITIVEME